MDTYLVMCNEEQAEFADDQKINLIKNLFEVKKVHEEHIDLVVHDYISNEKIFILRNGVEMSVVSIVDDASVELLN